MKYKFLDKTNSYDKKLSEPTGGIKTYFKNIRCYKNIIYAEVEFYLMFLMLLSYSAYETVQTKPGSLWIFSLFAGLLFCFFIYIVIGGLLPSGTDNVIACIRVDLFHSTPDHITQYFPLSISVLTFGSNLSEEKEKILRDCLWIYHLANKELTWHFFLFRSISNYLFLSLFILLFFIERSLSIDMKHSLLPYNLIFASIIITGATAYKLSKIHDLIIKELPKALGKLGIMRYIVRVPDKSALSIMTEDIFYYDFVRTTYKVDRMGTYMLFVQLILPIFITIITTYLKR